MSLPKHWTIGVVGHGIAGRSDYRTTPEKCADFGHPGVTYNPWHDITACLCGLRWFDGDHSSHAACCGGPLTEAARS